MISREIILGVVKLAVSKYLWIPMSQISDKAGIMWLWEKQSGDTEDTLELLLDLEEIFLVNILSREREINTVGELADYIKEALDAKFEWALN